MSEKKVYISCGRTDMRRGIDGLVKIVSEEGLDVFDSEAMYLFCGRKKDRYKTLHWDREGFSLTYKRLEAGKLQWPKDEEEAKGIQRIDSQQLKWLLEGLSMYQPKAVKQAKAGHVI